jgi:hypothetical protein
MAEAGCTSRASFYTPSFSFRVPPETVKLFDRLSVQNLAYAWDPPHTLTSEPLGQPRG